MATREKTGGRKAGTPNKITASLKTRINDLLEKQFDSLVDDIEDLEPKERVATYIKLLEFAVPRQSRVQQQMGFDYSQLGHGRQIEGVFSDIEPREEWHIGESYEDIEPTPYDD